MPMIRRVLQFNDLQFNGTLLSYSESTQTKLNSQSYANGHGEYYSTSDAGHFLEASDINVSVNFKLNRYGTRNMELYARYIKSELYEQGVGRLWAVDEAHRLMWCRAVISSKEFTHANIGDKTFGLNVTFRNIDGYWVYADKYQTFLYPNPCACSIFMCSPHVNECDLVTGFCGANCANNMRCTTNVELTATECCAKLYSPKVVSVDHSNVIEILTNASATDLDSLGLQSLCDYGDNFYTQYSKNYPKFLYSPEYAFSVSRSGYLGQSFKFVEIGNYYYNGSIPSSNGQIILNGSFTDPEIRINGHKIALTGTYSGWIVFNLSDNAVYHSTNSSSPFAGRVDITKYLTSETKIPLAVFNPGINSVYAKGQTGSNGWFYIKAEQLTV